MYQLTQNFMKVFCESYYHTKLHLCGKMSDGRVKQNEQKHSLVLLKSNHDVSWLDEHQLFFWLSSILFLISDITWAGSGAPNTELPATMQFAPAEAAMSIVEGPKPPSTYKKLSHFNKRSCRQAWRKWSFSISLTCMCTPHTHTHTHRGRENKKWRPTFSLDSSSFLRAGIWNI